MKNRFPAPPLGWSLKTSCIVGALLLATQAMQGSIANGTINDFYTVNDTSNVCHGFEIELDRLSQSGHLLQRLNSQSLYHGTGIGLAIAKKASERFGARFSVESAPGKGNRFWLELAQAD